MSAHSLLRLVFLVITLAACSTLRIVPVATEKAIVDLTDNSVKVSSSGVSVTASYEPIELYSQNLVGYVASFRVSVLNDTKGEIGVDHDSFVLLDENNNQYLPLVPAKVKELLTKDTYYLVPYPYVGFYYLEDYEKSNFINQNSSNLPYYYEVNPQELFSKAFTPGLIVPSAASSGLIYFALDPSEHSRLNLLFFKKGTSKSSPPDSILQFAVKK